MRFFLVLCYKDKPRSDNRAKNVNSKYILTHNPALKLKVQTYIYFARENGTRDSGQP